MALCQKHKIHLISDEVYALSIFDSKDSNAVPFTSVLAIDSTNLLRPEYLHVLYGMSKAGCARVFFYILCWGKQVDNWSLGFRCQWTAPRLYLYAKYGT